MVMALGEEQLPQASTRHSEDYLRAMVRRIGAATWEPPREPPGVERPEVEVEHVEACRLSLEEFINSRIEQLSGMVRTGRVVLPPMRVRVEIYED